MEGKAFRKYLCAIPHLLLPVTISKPGRKKIWEPVKSLLLFYWFLGLLFWSLLLLPWKSIKKTPIDFRSAGSSP